MIVFEKDSDFAVRSQGYGLTMQQGVAALQQLAVDVNCESVSSDVHYSFDPSGHVIGCYGRSLLSSSRGGRVVKNAEVDKEHWISVLFLIWF